MAKQYCSKCKTTTSPKNYGAGEFCSKCFNYYDGKPRVTHTTREASQDLAVHEVTLREAFGKMGLSEGADRDNLIHNAVRQMALEDEFMTLGMNESEARSAARGRGGLGEAVMDVFRQARELLKSTENLDEKQLEDSFRAWGLSESEAGEAAKGRG